MRLSHSLVLLLFVLASLALPAHGEGFVRSIGLRFTLPFGESPLLVGVEVTSDFGPAIGTATFFLSTQGEGLFLIGADVPVTESGDHGMAYVQFLTGFYYFDLAAFAPSLLFGGGLRLESTGLHPILAGLAVDLIYPIAVPFPLFSASFGWVLP
jgi:hypothetical protein